MNSYNANTRPEVPDAWDFEEYTMADGTLRFVNHGHAGEAEIFFTGGVDDLRMTIVLGDKQKQFVFTVDARDALEDLLCGRVIGATYMEEEEEDGD